MKVLLVNGSPHEKGCTYTALAEVAGALEKQGIETEIFQYRGKASFRLSRLLFLSENRSDALWMIQ